MRSLLLLTLVATALAAAAPSASAFRRPYAQFKVSVTGTETTTVTGQEQCQDESGTVAPATASETAQFHTTKTRVLELAKGGKVISVVRPHPPGATTVTGAGTMTRQSDFVPNGSNPPVCQGGTPGAGCGTVALNHITLLVQGGVNEVHLSASGLKPSPGLCLVPTLAFPEMPGTVGGLDNLKTHYSAKVPKSMLNPRKHVVLIHGTGTSTTHGQEGSIIVNSATTTLKFTMRLVRVPLR